MSYEKTTGGGSETEWAVETRYLDALRQQVTVVRRGFGDPLLARVSGIALVEDRFRGQHLDWGGLTDRLAAAFVGQDCVATVVTSPARLFDAG